MIMFWLAVFGAMLTAFFSAVVQPAQVRQDSTMNADTLAIQIFAYGASVNDYINANPTFTTGAAPEFCSDVALPPTCLNPQPGLANQRPVEWLAYIERINDSPRILLYTNNPEPGRDVLAALLQRGGGSLYIGKKGDGNKLYSMYGRIKDQSQDDIMHTLPAIINDQATVVVWRQ